MLSYNHVKILEDKSYKNMKRILIYKVVLTFILVNVLIYFSLRYIH